MSLYKFKEVGRKMSHDKIKYMTKVKKVEQLSLEEKEGLNEVEQKFVFRSNTYYNSPIDWDNPKDPLKKLVIPDSN